MANEFELSGDVKAGAVVGTTTHSGWDVSQYGQMKRNQYAYLTTVGSTYILSTAAVITGLKVIPTSSGAGAFTLADGTTSILVIPAASYIPDPRPHFVDFGPNGIRNTAAAGFKVTLGASVACLVTGYFVGAITTA
jgi:hypothetical protein